MALLGDRVGDPRGVGGGAPGFGAFVDKHDPRAGACGHHRRHQTGGTGEPGTPFRYHSADGQSLWGDETVLESDPPHRLVVGWLLRYSRGLTLLLLQAES